MLATIVHPDPTVKLQEILRENQRLFLKMYCSPKTLTLPYLRKKWTKLPRLHNVFVGEGVR